MKANTFVPFTNIAIALSFVFDIAYSNRLVLVTDYIGLALIILCTMVLTVLGNNQKQSEKSNEIQRPSVLLREPLISKDISS